MMRRVAHWTVAGVSGFCVIVLEFAAVRLMAPAFGQSNYVWSNVIGTILLALALGYWAGGRLGERSRSGRPLYLGYAICALWTLGVAYAGPALCQALTPSGFGQERLLPLGFTGSFITVLLLFCPPVFLLGMTSPFLIRLEARSGHEGRATGGLYAVGTVGSLLGCYLAPLEMLQVLGTRATLLTAAGLVGALSIGGLLLTRSARSDAAPEALTPLSDDAPAVGRTFVWIAALTGLAVTVIEFAAVRFMAPWFGQSNYVWANVIGVILLALALGSWMGGRWADASARRGEPGGWPLFVALALGGGSLGVVTLLGPGVMEKLIPQRVGDTPIDSMHLLPIAFRGSLVATVVFFGPAFLLLGVVPPFLVRLAAGEGHTGRTAGVLFAWTTVGGLLGCFLTASVLVPVFGSRGALLLAALGIVLLALAGLRKRQGAARIIAAIAALFLVTLGLMDVFSDAPLRTQPGQLAELESAYQTIRVVQQPVNLLVPQESEDLPPANPGRGEETETVFLRHDEDAETYQSMLLVDRALSERWLSGGRYFEHMALGAYFARPPREGPLRVLIIGYAGGTVHRTIRQTYGAKRPYHVLGVEIDPAVIDVAREHLAHAELEGDHLELVTGEDARTVVNALPAERRFDLVLVDAYTRTNYVPFQLASFEFFESVERHLAPGGWIGVNVLGNGIRSPVADAVATTMASVYGNAYVAPNPAFLGNVILWAAPGAKRGPRVHAGAQLHDGLKTAAFALERLLVRHRPEAGRGLVLTDDLSPSDRLADHEMGVFGRRKP